MHIPDGFLDPRVCAATGAVSAVAVGAALRRVRPDADPRLTPLMGITAAYIFAAQMVNFPVAAGTSGHLLGSLLAAVLLGPHAATVVMASVFVIQTLFFLDGGHTALGANILNMGLAGTYGGYALYRALAGPRPTSRRSVWAAAAAAWASLVLGAALTAAQLAASGAVATGRVFPAMLGVHALLGVGEALLTGAALGLLWKVRPDLLTSRGGGTDGRGVRRWGWAAAAAGLVALGTLAPFASSSPDGLERVAQMLHFEHLAGASAFSAPLPDYTLPHWGEAAWAPAAVSLLGSGLMIGSVALLARLRRRNPGDARVALQVDPRVKLGCALGLALTAALLPAGQAGKLLFLAGFAALWVVASRASARWLAGRALLLLPFLVLAALSLPQVRSQDGPGAHFYGLAFLRAGISLLATAAFVATTSEADALAALAACRLPQPIIDTIGFALRYTRSLREDAARMLQARA
ncbi:MAG TPA: energy-coupling factor ABC transporter permease, partial [Armatimonadota bacterium]|nr:energy-coupling factor ABC transporter permease [Armatimonadota bacterium]